MGPGNRQHNWFVQQAGWRTAAYYLYYYYCYYYYYYYYYRVLLLLLLLLLLLQQQQLLLLLLLLIQLLQLGCSDAAAASHDCHKNPKQVVCTDLVMFVWEPVPL